MLIVVSVLVLVAAGPAAAASLKQVSQEVTQHSQPPDTAEQLEPCTGFAAAAASGGANGIAFAQTSASVGATFTDPSCPDIAEAPQGSAAGTLPPDLIAAAIALSVRTFTIEPDEGESEGDPLTMCFRTSRNQSARGTGLQPHSEIGVPAQCDTFDPNEALEAPTLSLFEDPIVIRLLPLVGSPSTIFEFGPQVIAAGSDADATMGTFDARVGDQIALHSGSAAFISGTGVGSASADAANRLSVEIGRCDVGAPAMSPTYMAALVMILLGMGALSLVRNATRDRGAVATSHAA